MDKVKILLKQQHLKELEKILDSSFSAHSRAHWDSQEARQVIIQIIMTKFKKSLGIT